LLTNQTNGTNLTNKTKTLSFIFHTLSLCIVAELLQIFYMVNRKKSISILNKPNPDKLDKKYLPLRHKYTKDIFNILSSCLGALVAMKKMP